MRKREIALPPSNNAREKELNDKIRKWASGTDVDFSFVGVESNPSQEETPIDISYELYQGIDYLVKKISSLEQLMRSHSTKTTFPELDDVKKRLHRIKDVLGYGSKIRLLDIEDADADTDIDVAVVEEQLRHIRETIDGIELLFNKRILDDDPSVIVDWPQHKNILLEILMRQKIDLAEEIAVVELFIKNNDYDFVDATHHLKISDIIDICIRKNKYDFLAHNFFYLYIAKDQHKKKELLDAGQFELVCDAISSTQEYAIQASELTILLSHADTDERKNKILDLIKSNYNNIVTSLRMSDLSSAIAYMSDRLGRLNEFKEIAVLGAYGTKRDDMATLLAKNGLWDFLADACLRQLAHFHEVDFLNIVIDMRDERGKEILYKKYFVDMSGTDLNIFKQVVTFTLSEKQYDVLTHFIKKSKDAKKNKFCHCAIRIRGY